MIKKKIIILGLFLFLGFAYLNFFSSIVFPWQKESVIQTTLNWGGLAELPKEIENLSVEKDGSLFSRTFIIEFNEKYEYSNYIASHFGDGILTFSLPYLFKTEKSYGLFLRGPTNHVKHNITYLDAFVETDWLNFTFTYNIIY